MENEILDVFEKLSVFPSSEIFYFAENEDEIFVKQGKKHRKCGEIFKFLFISSL